MAGAIFALSFPGLWKVWEESRITGRSLKEVEVKWKEISEERDSDIEKQYSVYQDTDEEQQAKDETI